MQGISEEQKKSQEVRGGMIDIEHAKQEFENYLDEYDRQDEQIYLKIEHTYGVVKYAGEIARRMECSREDVELAELIGLLHDIGRFEQIRRFHSFEPGTMDHAVFGAELLFGEEKMIRRFVREDLFDDLINAAIRKHSDFKLEGIHDARTLFHAKLIRDADKLDNCRVKLVASIEAMLGVSEEEAEFDGKRVWTADGREVSLSEIGYASFEGHNRCLSASESHSSPVSPPPFMVGAAEVEVDTETGEVKVLEFDACVDCGTPINPNLTRVQAEGGLLQGIGMTLTENVTYDRKGCPEENSLFQYKIPTRIDIGKINVEFENSYEPNGPFGAKSIGEVVINTPLPAISDAIYNAIGTRFYELPITPEQIAMAAAENHK